MVYVFLAEGFEEVEALTVIDVLRRAGVVTYSVKAASQESTADSALLVTGAHGITVLADRSFDSIDSYACRMIVLPGGMPGTRHLKEHAGLVRLIRKFAETEGKYIAAICAAPMVLGELGILEGRRATIYPGMEDSLKGAFAMKNRVVVDDQVITSKGPGTAMEFAVELAAILKGKEKAEELMQDLVMGR